MKKERRGVAKGRGEGDERGGESHHQFCRCELRESSQNKDCEGLTQEEMHSLCEPKENGSAVFSQFILLRQSGGRDKE